MLYHSFPPGSQTLITHWPCPLWGREATTSSVALTENPYVTCNLTIYGLLHTRCHTWISYRVGVNSALSWFDKTPVFVYEHTSGPEGEGAPDDHWFPTLDQLWCDCSKSLCRTLWFFFKYLFSFVGVGGCWMVLTSGTGRGVWCWSGGPEPQPGGWREEQDLVVSTAGTVNG